MSERSDQSQLEIVNVSGPPGSGKDTLINELIRRFGADATHRVTTITTKKVRPDDYSYTHVEKDELLERIRTGTWLVNWQEGNEIGFATSIDEIADETKKGKLCIHSIFSHETGAGMLRRTFGARLLSFAMLPSDGDLNEIQEKLFARMLSRNLESKERIQERLRFTRDVIDFILRNPIHVQEEDSFPTFDEVLINRDGEISKVIEHCVSVITGRLNK